jgi:hypothetical protein
MSDHQDDNKEIVSNILLGATTMVGVCITIIALFRVMNVHVTTIADEILGVNTSLFITSALLAYAAMRNKSRTLTKWADIFFFTGMVIMLIVGMVIVYTTY